LADKILTRQPQGIPIEALNTLGDRCPQAVPMADKGADWNPGDVVDRRPNARLIEANHIGADWYIYYEQGGYGEHEVLAILPSTSASAASLYIVPNSVHSLSELDTLARQGKLSKGSC
jgi:hypothetical protein